MSENVRSTGFLKVGNPKHSTVTPSQRSALIRKGNELFNSGEYEIAKKIFITTSYSDGLIRMGDYYREKGDPLEALKMYRIAPAKEKLDLLLEETAVILREWLQEE
jgi:hypothetical protein